MTDPPALEPLVLAPPARVAVRIAADGMSAFATIVAGEPGTATDADDALRAAGVVHGIDAEGYAALVRALESDESQPGELAIARGTAPGESRDGWFEPAFRPGLEPGHVRDDGTWDFHDRELLKGVASGDLLGRFHPPLEGAPGMRIDGQPVAPRPARAAQLAIGSGAERDPDGGVLATRAGVIIYVEGRSIEVGTHYVHEGDVDLRSGDLYMEGSLLVRSDVQRGFVASATGDLEIRGGIEGGSAYAGANLLVFGGVRGSEGSMVSAEGNLTLRHAERARVDCGGAMELTDAVNCDLSASRIHLARSLRGGRAMVEASLVTRDAGTPSARVDTLIEAGVPRENPESDARGMLQEAKAWRMATRRASGPRGGASERAHRPMAGKIARELANVRRGALARKIERAEQVAALAPAAFIEVRGAVHPGVQIRIGDTQIQIEDALRSVRFTLDVARRTIRTEGILR